MAVGVQGEKSWRYWPARQRLQGTRRWWFRHNILARAPDELSRVILVSAGDGADPASRTSVVAFEQGMKAAGWSAGVNIDAPKPA